MRKGILMLTAAILCAGTLYASENNESNQSSVEEQIRKQMEREKQYAKEQKFYQGEEYDLDAHKVDPTQIRKVPKIEPDYDFDMTDVYSD